MALPGKKKKKKSQAKKSKVEQNVGLSDSESEVPEKDTQISAKEAGYIGLELR